jgi:hypothetical protein
MEFPLGTLYYHYTTRSAAFEHIVPSGKLRLSPYARMNDPLENKPWRLQGRFDIGGAGDLETLEPAQRAFGEFVRGAKLVWESAKLLALTVDAEKGYGGRAQPFGRGWSRARMWDQYGERHTGVCLLFNRRRLQREIRRSLRSQGLDPPHYRRVRYTAGGPAERIRELDLGSLVHAQASVTVRRFIDQNRNDLFFLKTRDWESEFEYRFVVTAPEVDWVYFDYGEALEAVVVGERFPVWQEAGAINSCHEASVPLARINWSSGVPRADELSLT